LEELEEEAEERADKVLLMEEGELVGRKKRPFYNALSPMGNRKFETSFTPGSPEIYKEWIHERTRRSD
jgi:hypothetical protein